MSGLEVGVLVAFAGGVLSFLSPCVLPLAPPYLAFLSGKTLDQMTGPSAHERRLNWLALAALGLIVLGFWRLIATEGQAGVVGFGALGASVAILGYALSLDSVTRRVFTSALFFVLGLATVFVALGATASAAGQLLAIYKREFAIVAGLVIYVLGQHFIGLSRALPTVAIMFGLWALAVLLQGGGLGAAAAEYWPLLIGFAGVAAALQFSGYEHIPFLYREARFDAGRAAGGHAGAYVIGLAFAFGWTPCIGPILGAIIALAAQEETIGRGVAMLAVYAAGLGLPFLLAALFVRPFMRFMRGFRRYMGAVETGMGGLLVAVGALMATGAFENLAYWLLEAFPGLATIG